MAGKTKYLPVSSEQLEGLEELRGGLDELRRLVRFVKASNLSDPLQCLFEMALMRHYDREVNQDGLDQLAGHALYRLSDQVPEHVRRTMPVRGPAGSLQHNGPSLEDWRAEWEAVYSQIPRLRGAPLELPGL